MARAYERTVQADGDGIYIYFRGDKYRPQGASTLPRPARGDKLTCTKVEDFPFPALSVKTPVAGVEMGVWTVEGAYRARRLKEPEYRRAYEDSRAGATRASEQADADDPTELKRHIAELQTKLDMVLDQVAEPSPDAEIRSAVTEFLRLGFEEEGEVDGMKVHVIGGVDDARGPLGGVSGRLTLVVTDAQGFAHGVNVHVYSDDTVNRRVKESWPHQWQAASRRQRRINSQGLKMAREARVSHTGEPTSRYW